MAMSDELTMIIDVLRSSGFNAAELSIEERRQWLDSFAAAEPPTGALIDGLEVAGCPAEWIVADGAREDRAILWLHGGAFTSGGLRTHRGFAAALSRFLGIAVVLLEYPLAPEFPFPAALDAAVGAYRWLLDDRSLTPEQILIGGDSAGGGLALSTLVALRELGVPQPAGAVLLSPWTDLTMSGPSYDTEAEEDPMCSRQALELSVVAYVGDHPREDPRCSPVRGDLSSLAPLLIHVGTREVLRDDSVAIGDLVAASGGEVELWVAPGMIHVWHLFTGIVPESDEALERVAAWARPRLGLAELRAQG